MSRLVGLTLSIIGRRRVVQQGHRGRGPVIGGIVVGTAAIMIAILCTAVLVAVLLPRIQQLQQESGQTGLRRYESAGCEIDA